MTKTHQQAKKKIKSFDKLTEPKLKGTGNYFLILINTLDFK